MLNVSIYFGVLRRFQHCAGHITMGSWKGRGNQYIQFVRVLYCKLPTNGKQLPAFLLEAVPGTEPRPQRWEATSATVPPRTPGVGGDLCPRAPPPPPSGMLKVLDGLSHCVTSSNTDVGQ